MLYILLHLLTCAYQKHLMDVLVPCLRRHMDQEPKPIELWLDFCLFSMVFRAKSAAI